MANPNNALGISNPNGAVSVYPSVDPSGANHVFSAGVTEGFVVRPTSPAGMSVAVGGQAGVADDAILKNETSGQRYPIHNTSSSPIELIVPAKPSTNSRIDSVVLYYDTSVICSEDNASDCCGIEIISGTSASSPVAPTDAQIKEVIGAMSAYIVIANIRVSSSTTTITASDITNLNPSVVKSSNIQLANNFVKANNIDFTTFGNYSTNNSGSISVNKNSSSPVTVATISNVKGGKYLINYAAIALRTNTGGNGEFNTITKINGTNSGYAKMGFLSSADYSSTMTASTHIADIPNGATVTLVAWVNWPDRGAHKIDPHTATMTLVQVA